MGRRIWMERAKARPTFDVRKLSAFNATSRGVTCTTHRNIKTIITEVEVQVAMTWYVDLDVKICQLKQSNLI